MNENIFDKLDFGPFRSLLDNDDITDISYDNNGQIWIRSLTQGSMRVEIEGATPEFVEKLAFQCSNVMGTTFNNAKPFLDAESSELRMNFVHQSIATNGIALVIRKTPAKIRLEKEKLIQEDYFTPAIHDLLIKCVQGHCNIMVAGETGSGKTEFVKYLASHTITNEKIITIEDTLELHLDKIYPERDIVAMKTNNVASYSDVLVTCMRQNPKWILLSEVRSAEAVSAVRNSISSGHNILSTIHADKASAIPYRLYSLMETDLDVNQFLNTIYRYIQIGVHIRAFYSKEYGQFHREVDEVCEFYVDDNNEPVSRIIYQKQFGKIMMCKPSQHLVEYIENQNMSIQDIIKDLPDNLPLTEVSDDEGSSDDGGAQLSLDGAPGAKSEEETTIVPGADLGHEESIPTVTSDGNVLLSTPAVLPLGGLLAQNVGSNAYVNAQLVSGAESQQVPMQQAYAAQPQMMMPQQAQYYQTPQMMPQQVAYGSVPQMTQQAQYPQAPQMMPQQTTDYNAMQVAPQGQAAYNSVPQMTGYGDVPQMVQPAEDANAYQPVIVDNSAVSDQTIPVVDNSIPVNNVGFADVPVMTDTNAAVPTDNPVMPVVESSEPVMESVSTLLSTDNSVIPVVENSTESVDNNSAILGADNSVIPVVENSTEVVDNNSAIFGTDNSVIPVVDNSTESVDNNSAILATDSSVMPVVDNSTEVVDNNSAILGADSSVMLVVQNTTEPVVDNSATVSIDSPVMPVVESATEPVMENNIPSLDTTSDASLGSVDTVIPIVQEPSQDVPLPLENNPATGGDVIPNIIKLDQ